jgi:DNA-binding transcriptional regulator YhcF (GntR family)
MRVHIDIHSSVPVYRQIADALRVALVNRELLPGDALPSVRRLALDLGVHFNTVAQAYRELAHEGWLAIGARSGARVCQRSTPAAPAPPTDETFRRRIETLIAQMRARGMRRARLARQLRRIAAALEQGSGS